MPRQNAIPATIKGSVIAAIGFPFLDQPHDIASFRTLGPLGIGFPRQDQRRNCQPGSAAYGNSLDSVAPRHGPEAAAQDGPYNERIGGELEFINHPALGSFRHVDYGSDQSTAVGAETPQTAWLLL